MKSVQNVLLFSAVALISACNSAAPTPVNSTTTTTTTSSSNDKPQTAISHTTENQTPNNPATSGGTKSRWTQGGTAFDTTKYDTAVTAAEKALSGKPTDDKAKKALATAYLDRANALTKNQQYASALGDYRRCVKNDPTNEEAKQWIDQITKIYDSINRESPKEGEEPPPLPFNGGATK